MKSLPRNEINSVVNIKHFNPACLFLLFLLTAFVPDSLAEDKQADNKQNKETISIAVGDWPPYISQEQKMKGVATHIITDIFHDIGIEAKVEFLPWTRAYNNTANGEYAATAVWMHQDDREQDFIFSDAVLNEQFVFFHRQAQAFDWQTVLDLKDYRIGGGYAYSYGPEMDAAIAKGELTLSRVTNLEQNLKMLLHGRIDILPLEVNVGLSALREHLSPQQQKKISYHAKPFLLNSSYVMFPRSSAKSKDLVKRFNQQLSIIKQNGRYQEYFRQFEQGHYKILK